MTSCFWSDLSLEARAEILCSYFGRNDDLINYFWYLLTFRSDVCSMKINDKLSSVLQLCSLRIFMKHTLPPLIYLLLRLQMYCWPLLTKRLPLTSVTSKRELILSRIKSNQNIYCMIWLRYPHRNFDRI